jgi:hypothetical protein
MTKRIPVTVVVTCGPGCEPYISQAVGSVIGEVAEVIVVWDNTIPQPTQARNIVTTHGNVQLARWDGVQQATYPNVLFLDGDNLCPPGRCGAMLAALQHAPANCAGVYTGLRYMDEPLTHCLRTLATQPWDRVKWELCNYVDASCLFRKELLMAAWVPGCPHYKLEDHHMVRQLLDAGLTMHPAPGAPHLTYRVRRNSMSATEHSRRYAVQYNLLECPVTAWVALSGRVALWPGLRAWLATLPARVRLVLCDNSGDAAFGRMVAGHGLPLEDVRLIRRPPIIAGLAELPRLAHEDAVNAAVSKLHNEALQQCTTPLFFSLEDDVLPRRRGGAVLNSLAMGMGPDVFASTGYYYSRYMRAYTVARKTGEGKQVDFFTRVAPHRAHPAAAAGFGCLLLRTQVAQQVPLLSVQSDRWFDIRFFKEHAKLGHRLVANGQVICDHFNADGTPTPTP